MSITNSTILDLIHVANVTFINNQKLGDIFDSDDFSLINRADDSFTKNSSRTNATLADNHDLSPDQEIKVWLSQEALEIAQIINHVILSGIVCLVGMIVNIINMILFVQQGLDNTVNISMFATAVSDWCSLVTLEWLNINLNPFMEKADISYEPAEVQYLTGGWPHACFLQITIWITVYVTAERFVCIAFPLKVKEIITPLRTKTIIICIFILMFIVVSPMYVIFYFGENFYPERNETRLGIRKRTLETDLETAVYMTSAVIGLVSFAMLIIFTCLLVVTLKRKSDWRQRSTMNGEVSRSVSARDAKAMKMISLIAGILIICTAPGMIFSVVVYIEPEFNIYGEYGRVVHICFSLAFLAEAINSTVNIIFFYKMSSKYRRQFRELFAVCGICAPGEKASDRPVSATSHAVPSASTSASNIDGAPGSTSQTSSTTVLTT